MGEGEYASLSREELIARIRRLEGGQGPSASAGAGKGAPEEEERPEQEGRGQQARPSSELGGRKGKKREREREFDFDQYETVHIALHLTYFGQAYDGLASQEHTDRTIEGQLFKALETAKLVRDRASANYSRCGRTDKGVSAFGQVVALTVRTGTKKPGAGSSSSGKRQKVEAAAEKDSQEGQREGGEPQGLAPREPEKEIDYIGTLNRLLPPDIRVNALAHVSPTFNARFDCISRTYKYFFMIRDMDVEKIRAGAKFLVGRHDFKNFCKIDRSKAITNFEREIFQFDVDVVKGPQSPHPLEKMYVFTISGKAFLWHQVRMMVAVLFLVGRGLEQPEIVRDLLDPSKYPSRPAYQMASEIPLVLYHCAFENLYFFPPVEHHQRLLSHYFERMEEQQVVATMTASAIEHAQSFHVRKASPKGEFVPFGEAYPYAPSFPEKKYIPISRLSRVGDSGGR